MDLGNQFNNYKDKYFGKDFLTLLFVGRLDEQKGFDLLYEAMRKLTRKDVRLVVVGDGVLKKSQYEKVDNIIFLGWLDREKVLKIYKDADVT
ncbi:glycosyltransferase, partial [Staphylococcus aureus]|uniref:glycosyltransferase n=1 Tax=Staphylococcus aureus TaxID=1280 RepID=UPI00301D915D